MHNLFYWYKDQDFARTKPIAFLFVAGVMASLLHSDARRLCSWWWDSNIPKNSKWFQENLTEMDAKVKAMIKLIEEDADSFARRAEMYYKKRPELLKLVQEFYRAYRALAERYDRVTCELRQAQNTMSEAFPDQMPFLLDEDSPMRPSTQDTEPYSPEVLCPTRASSDTDNFHQDVMGLTPSSTHAAQIIGSYTGDPYKESSKWGLKQLLEMLGAGEEMLKNSKIVEGKLRNGLNRNTEEKEKHLHNQVSELSNENDNLKSKFLTESEHFRQAEAELQNLKEALASTQAEKEATFIQYQKCLEQLSAAERELSSSQKDSVKFSEQASRAENEVQKMKESLIKLEAERDASLSKHKEYLERISDLEIKASQALEDTEELNKRAITAEAEAQNLRNEISKFESEKDAVIHQYKLCMVSISDLEKRLLVSQEESRMLRERADRAEAEIKKLKFILMELSEEKEAAVQDYKHCLDKVSKLEEELACSQEDVKLLNGELSIGAAKLKNTEDKCVLLEISNHSLYLETDNLAKKIAMKDQELSEKQTEVEKLQIDLQNEHLRHAQIETTLQALENLHSQSQEEQRALAMELKNVLELLKDMETCKISLEGDLKRVKDENHSLSELNSSSTNSIENLENEILRLRKMKEKLEDEVSEQAAISNNLQQEISCLKEEIKNLNRSYRALLEQVKAAGINPECIDFSIKNLQEENSNLRKICEKTRSEKEVLNKKLEYMDELREKKAVLESSLSDVNAELQGSREKVRALQESCQILNGEKSTLVSEKAALLSQLQIITENMQKLLDRNAALENSLLTTKVELEGLRENARGLEDICHLLKNEKSNILAERGDLAVLLENVERQLKCLETRFMGLEEKYACLEKEKKAEQLQVEELRVSVEMEKQERTNFTHQSETRLIYMENHIHHLQEESKWRKKEFDEELDKALKSQFEIFILQTFIQDMEEKNYSLLMECQKHIETSKLADKVIAKLENERIEQQLEAEILVDEIGRLRLGIYQVFKALEHDSDFVSAAKVENEQTFLHRVLASVENLKCSLRMNEYDKQQLLVENSVLVTLLAQLKSEGLKLESTRKSVEKELNIMAEKLVTVQKDNHGLLEMNKKLQSEMSSSSQLNVILEREVQTVGVKHDELQTAYLELQKKYSQVLHENETLLTKISGIKEEKWMVEQENDAFLLGALALGNFSTVFKSYGSEKTAELKSINKDMHKLHGVILDFEKEMTVLNGKLETKETENLLLKKSVQGLEKELHEVRESNDHLKLEMSNGRELLGMQEAGLLEAEEKLKASENLNSELSRALDALKTDCLESLKMNKDLEKRMFEISKENTSQYKEMEYLREANMNLVSELSKLHEEIEEKRIREDCLSSELQEKDYEFGLWEAEAATFYFEFQNSSIREALLENKMDELTEVYGRLEDENASKSVEIEQMTETINLMENEIGDLKLQLHAYAPVVASLRDDVVSLEHNALLHTRLELAGSKESTYVEGEVHPESSSEKMIEDQPVMTKDILDLLELRTRIKAVEKVVEQRNMPKLQVSSYNKFGRDSTESETESSKTQHSIRLDKHEHAERRSPRNEYEDSPKRRKTKPKSFDIRNRILMKDIPLDHVSDGSRNRVRRRGSSGSGDHMLELWETAEGCSPNKSVKDKKKGAIHPTEMGYNQFTTSEWRSNHPPTESEVEKELDVDKLELSMNSSEATHETNKKILERLACDAEKLMTLQMTVDNMRRKLDTNRKARKAKTFDFEAAKEQLQEVELMVVQLVNLNGHLMKSTEESILLAGNTSTDLKEVMNFRRNRVSEQAIKGSEKVERLQLEVQKLQFMLLKLDDEKNTSRSNTGIALKNFIHIGKRNSEKRKKAHLCGCFTPSGSSSHV